MIGNQEKVLLRQIAMDPGALTIRRLKAVDTLCSDACLFRTDRDHSVEYRPPSKREKKFAIRALRSILKSQKPLTAATRVGIRDRLRLLATGKDIHDTLDRKYLWIPGPENPNQPQGQSEQPEQPESSVAQDIAKFLEEQEAKNVDH